MASTSVIVLVLIIVVVALAFDFINGFHDAANSIATVVSTRVLSPKVAVAGAAFFNLLAAFGTGTLVAKTIGKGIVLPDVIDPTLLLAALIGAITWNLITWYFGLPSSSSHALIGGLAGAAIVKAGFSSLIMWQTTSNPLIYRGILGIAIYIVVAPLLGFLLGLFFMTTTAWLLRRQRPSKVDGWFRKLQLLSASLYSFSHGSNDAQKTMGIIYALLIAAGLGSYAHGRDVETVRGTLLAANQAEYAQMAKSAVPEILHGTLAPSALQIKTAAGELLTLADNADTRALAPRIGGEVELYGVRETLSSGELGFKQKDSLAWWIIIAAQLAIALGTYMGGWRIVKTMGSKITKLQPYGGFCAETGGGLTILGMSYFGIPVSTTHTITGAIVGVGATRRLSAVRWGVARTVVWAWVFTIPAAAIVAALAYLPFKFFW